MEKAFEEITTVLQNLGVKKQQPDRLVIIAIIAFMVSVFIAGMSYQSMNGSVQWKAKGSSEYGGYGPADRYDQVVQEFGKPDIIDKKAGGGAYWFKKTLTARGFPYESIAILDEAIPHNKPAKHVDFLYMWIKLKASDEKILQDIRGLSKSVSYDPLKQVLQVRCHFMGANYATALLAIKIASKALTLEKIKEEDLYAKYILKTVEGSQLYDENAIKLYKYSIAKYLAELEGAE